MNARKKVLIFTPGGAGGAERMCVLIGKILPKECFDVKYVVIGRLKKIYNILPEGYDVDCIPVRNIYAFSTLRIWYKIISERPDIVFVSQEAYNGRVILASKLARRKIIVRSSNMIGQYKTLLLKQVKLTYPMADVLIAQQEEMRDEMLRILKVSPDKVVTLHNPLETTNIDIQKLEPSPYTQAGCINYVNIAHIRYNKSQDISIKAFSKVKKILSNSQLFFVGHYDVSSEYFKSLNYIVDMLGLRDSVFFVGYDKNPYKWIKNAQCFILPSRVEGLPNALIEASYLGVPCVATRCLDIVDNIIIDGENGYVVEVDDVDGLAEAMIKAIELEECKMVYKPGNKEDFIKLFENL